MALLSVIRRWHHREGMAIREIARRTGLSRNTVRKYLASNIVEPTTNSVNRSASSMIMRQPSPIGCIGNRIVAFARDWRRQQQEATLKASRGTYVPLSFALGEAFQFDWNEDWAMINGQNVKLQIAHFKLSYSRARLSLTNT